MTLDGDLRDLLTEQADRVEGPAPDIAAIRDGGLRIRRRRRRVVGASSALVALLIVGLGVGITEGLRDTDATDLPAGPPRGVGTVTEVPWCVGPDSSGGQRIEGEGAPISTLCHGARELHLWHHAGTTILTKNGTTLRVADGGLTPLGTSDGNVSMSHDGLLAAWLDLSTGGSNCGLLPLEVYEVATATEVAATEVETVPCGHLAGIDDLGRVYVTVSDGGTGALDVRMYDTGTGEWTRVSGLPQPAGHGFITYVTADGLAVQIAEDVVSGPDFRASIPLASLEGRVDAEGRFVPQREVPIGRGRWSPDRSLVADQQPEGILVRSADLTRRLALDLPRDLFAARPERLPEVDLIWESPTSLLAVSGLQAGSQVYRCDVRSGSCERVDRLGQPALGNGAQPGG
jgi:hypothetical protein